MFVSACPIVGRLSAYPAQSQEQLKSSMRRGENVIVDLGPSCFNALVHLDVCGGEHHQTTPARGEKAVGHRSVTYVPEGTDAITVYKVAGLWVLHTRGRPYTSTLVQAPPEVPSEIQWEWSIQVDLRHARENDWIPFCEDASTALEAVWSRVQSSATAESLSVATGQSTKIVLIEPRSVFFKHRDAYTNNRRWVRRSCRTLAECREKKNAMETRAQGFSDDSCAICTETFIETPHWPVVKTACGHPFHACCLQECKARGEARCPLCRADI